MLLSAEHTQQPQALSSNAASRGGLVSPHASAQGCGCADMPMPGAVHMRHHTCAHSSAAPPDNRNAHTAQTRGFQQCPACEPSSHGPLCELSDTIARRRWLLCRRTAVAARDTIQAAWHANHNVYHTTRLKLSAHNNAAAATAICTMHQLAVEFRPQLTSAPHQTSVDSNYHVASSWLWGQPSRSRPC